MTVLVIIIWVLIALYILFKFAQSVRVVPNRQVYIVERLGKVHAILNPGFHTLLPFIDKVSFIQDLREQVIEVPPQECFTRDNVKIHVDGVIYLRVVDPKKASYGITNYKYAAIQLARTTTRSVIGTIDLDQTFEERALISQHVVEELTKAGAAWGIEVQRYELKNIQPPETVRDAMEKQMAAERERRALLAKIEGDKMARINRSEGLKMEMINRSEGEKEKRINEAKGKAQEILAVAKATAESIEKIGYALSLQGGAMAFKLQLSQTLFDKFNTLANPKTSVILPADLTRMDQVLAGFGLDIEEELQEQEAQFPPIPHMNLEKSR